MRIRILAPSAPEISRMAPDRSRKRPASRWPRSVRWALTVCFGILATGTAATAHAFEYTAVDVEEIEAAIREFYPDPIIHIGPASSRCTYTAEDPCEADARVFVDTPNGLETVTVSKVGAHWIIGRWSKEVIEFRKCNKTKPRSECRGPSGRVGGRRD